MGGEAAQFQRRFNELWEQDDLWGLKELLSEVQAALARARKGGQ